MEAWLEYLSASPLATSQELRWGVLLGMAIGGSLVALVNYLRDLRRHHVDKLVEEKVERILALVEQRRDEVERRLRDERAEDEAKQAKPHESARQSTGPTHASTTSTSSNAGWEQKRPYSPASAQPQKSSPLKAATTTRSSPLASSASATTPSSPSPSSSSSSPSPSPSPSSSSSTSSSKSASPTRKLQKSYSTANIWRGEDETTLRKRQNLERQSSMQKLYGMEAEIAKKIEKKTEPLIEPMCKWLFEVLGEQGTSEQFPDCLKSGRLLCALGEKVWPGIITDVHLRPIVLLERENIQKYLDACAKMGIRRDDLFSVSDLYEEKYLAGVVQNVYAVARYLQQRKGWDGPVLLPPPPEKPTGA